MSDYYVQNGVRKRYPALSLARRLSVGLLQMECVNAIRPSLPLATAVGVILFLVPLGSKLLQLLQVPLGLPK